MSQSNDSQQQQENDNVLVVGLGASAGGLDPLRKFFNSLPAETGMAFIVVLHLSPDKESKLTEILQKETSMKILQVQERSLIERDHVYVIPPDKLLSVRKDHLVLSDFKKKNGIASIDLLFNTLALTKHKYSAGIIFSGSGSDGVAGMNMIKKEGGITIAQDPDEAHHSSMPASVIQTGAVDKVLPVKNIAQELMEYRDTLHQIRILEEAEEHSREEETGELLSEIFKKIKDRNKHEFRNYRRSSVLRRLDRRMRIAKIQTLKGYLDYLDKNPEEIDNLYKDLLISVTNFFRDPEAFKALEEKVIPKLFEDKEPNEQIRIWIPGCASGEEAYSIAILIYEYASTLDKWPDIQIFASDVDQKALLEARAGRYPKTIKKDISKERLNRFFIENGEEFKVMKKLRDMILFASHDILRNPPFSRLDLVTCRYMLIYLDKDLQTKLLKLFHYALRDNRYLFLGNSKSGKDMNDLFTPVSKKFRIYLQTTSPTSRISLPNFPLLNQSRRVSPYQKNAPNHKNKLEKMHWGILAEIYSPPSVLITEDYEVIHSTNGIDKFLQYSDGGPRKNILKMVIPQIRQPLRKLLVQLNSEELLSAQKKIWVKTDDESNNLELIARRFNNKDFPEGLLHLVFEEIIEEKKKSKPKQKKDSKNRAVEETDIINSLEKELDYIRERHQRSFEMYETSNDDLRASNEKLQLVNEELQSTTEELQTSQEELQSINKELKTVNEQLESKVEELNQAYSDLENLMEATEIGIIFVDRDYSVQRFTSTSTEIFNLISSDKGRPLKHITHSLEYEDLMTDIGNVLDNLEEKMKVVSTKEGRWFIMRMRPYRSFEEKMKGVVLSFTEFTELKEARETIKNQSLQETLATLGVYVLEQDDMEMVMHRAIQQCCALLNLQSAAILMYNKETDIFTVAEESGCECHDVTLENDKKWDWGFSLYSNKPVIVEDFTTEKRFEISPIMAEKKFSSSVYISIRGSGNVFGIFAAYTKEKRVFSKEELHFLQVVANILGRTIEQNKNREKLRESNRRLQNEIKRSEQLQKEIINNSVHERWELGGYLHDTLGQLLATVKILADDVRFKVSDSDIDLSEEVKEINTIMDKCISSVRDVTHSIIPVDIENEGVIQAFRFLMKQTRKLYSANCKLDSNNEVLEEIKNREAATHLYHIVQEACKNAATHGEADTVIVFVDEEDDHFILQIKDDGIGQKKAKDSNGKGVRIMEHRMDLLGGTFNISDYSDENASGTVVTCTLPMENLKQPEIRE